MFRAANSRGSLEDALDQASTGAERSHILTAARDATAQLSAQVHNATLEAVTTAVANGTTIMDCADHLQVSHRQLRYWLTHGPRTDAPQQASTSAAVVNAAAIREDLDRDLASAETARKLQLLGQYREEADDLAAYIHELIDQAAIDRLHEGVHPARLTDELGLTPNRVRALRKAARQ